MRNREVQALHQVLNVYERSKINTDHILDTMPTIFVLIDQDGRILRGNSDSAQLFGVSTGQLIGREMGDVFDESGKKGFQARLEALKSGEIERGSFDSMWVLPTGVSRYFVWEMSLLDGQFNGVKPYKLLGHDVTEYRRHVAAQVELSKEMEVLSAVQSLFLPHQHEVLKPHFDLVSYYQPAERVGGDWWRCDQENEDHVFLIVADVSGHGVGAAMITGALGSSYNLIRNMLDQVPSQERTQHILQWIDRNLNQICNGKYWVSVSVVELFLDSNQLFFWNAGGPPIFIKRKNGEFKKLSLPSTPLGSEDAQFKSIMTEFHPGDRFLVFSDGVFDFDQVDGRSFDLHSLKRLVEEDSSIEAREILSSVLKKLSEFEKPSGENRDDRTLLVFHRKHPREVS